MATNQIGIRNSNIIVPYTAATKRTKVVTLTVKLNTTYNGSTEVTSPVYVTKTGYAYADSSGNWRLAFNVLATFTSTTFTSYSLDITGVVFTASNGCAVTTTFDGSAFTTTTNVGRIYGFCPSTTSVSLGLSGDVALASEPTWAAANMEGVLPVDVYIPPASAGIAGLVNNAAGNTAGTPILGKTDGVAVASGYVGHRFDKTSSSTTIGASDATVNIATISDIPAGIWLLQANANCDPGSSLSATRVQASISTSSNTINNALALSVPPPVNSTASSFISMGGNYVNISSPTTFYFTGRVNYSGSGGAWSDISFYAIRIA